MKIRRRISVVLVGVTCLMACLGLRVFSTVAHAQDANAPSGPDPREIPIPKIKTPLGTLPGVKDLPVRTEMPDVMVMNDGTKVTTGQRWEKRREEMKRILEYYAVGQMPPPPGNVKGKEIKSEIVLDGAVKYRLVHLTFGPGEKLSLDIGVYTPVGGGPSPTIILQSGAAPGGSVLPRLPAGTQPRPRRRRVNAGGARPACGSRSGGPAGRDANRASRREPKRECVSPRVCAGHL